MARFGRTTLVIFFLGSVISLTGCQGLVIDTEKLLKPNAELSEIVGILAGVGTTFAAFPDLLAMLRRRSSEGMTLVRGLGTVVLPASRDVPARVTRWWRG